MAQEERGVWFPSDNLSGWIKKKLWNLSAEETLQCCLAQKWPWFIMEHCWKEDDSWPHSVFIANEVCYNQRNKLTVDGTLVDSNWGTKKEDDPDWLAGVFSGYRHCDLCSEDIPGVLKDLVKLNIPKPEPDVQYYEFTCTPDEYDPQRIVRECVEDGRLWFMVDRVRSNKQFRQTNLLFIRKDFLRDHVGVVDVQILDFEWGIGFTPCNSLVQCPVGYRCTAFSDNERDKLLEQLKEVTKPKKTYRVYYEGGK